MTQQPARATWRMMPPVDQLLRMAAEEATSYAEARPFPHAVIDGLFDLEALRMVAAEIPSRSQSGWTTWDTANEWKHVFDRKQRDEAALQVPQVSLD